VPTAGPVEEIQKKECKTTLRFLLRCKNLKGIREHEKRKSV